MRIRALNKRFLFVIVILSLLLIVQQSAFAFILINSYGATPKHIKANGTSSSDVYVTAVYADTGQGAYITVDFSENASGSISPTHVVDFGRADTTFTSSTTPERAIINIEVYNTYSPPWYGYRWQDVYVAKLQVKSIKFNSDHEVNGDNMLIDNNTDWTDSGNSYSQPEWLCDGEDEDSDPDRNYPITQTKETTLNIDVTVQVEPGNMAYDLRAPAYYGWCSFYKAGNTSNGGEQTFTISASSALPSYIGALSFCMPWYLEFDGEHLPLGIAGPATTHKVYVTYDAPLLTNQHGDPNVLTHYRIDHCLTEAIGQLTPDGAAIKIQDWLAGAGIDTSGTYVGTPPDDDNYWLLLSGSPYKGQCAEQAILMSMALRLLGIEGEYQHVYGSKQSDSNCLYPPDFRYCLNDAANEFLYLYFAATGRNYGEGTCTVGGIEGTYYAVYSDPAKLIGYTTQSYRGDLDMLQKLNCIQPWWLADNFDNPISQCTDPDEKYEDKPPYP